MTISGVMIVKNEQRCIKRCIESYKRIVNEVVVVDTGSTDDTVKIAQQLGARVCFFEWTGSFSDAKNYAIEQAKGDWIIFLDADEFFRDGDDKRLYRVITSANRQKNLNFLRCWLRNVVEEPDGTFRPTDGMVHLRVFKNRPNIRYVNDIHEYINQDDGDYTVQTIPEDQVTIFHDGYSYNRGKEKAGRNLPMLYAALDDIDHLSNNYFYIAQAHSGLRNYDFSFHYFLLHSDMSPVNVYGIFSHTLEKSVISNLPSSRILEEYNARCAHKRFPNHPTAYFLSGTALYGFGKLRLAAADFERAVELKRTHDFTEEYSQNRLDNSYDMVYSVIAQYSEMEGAVQKAYDYHVRALINGGDTGNAALYNAVRFALRNNCEQDMARALLPSLAKLDGNKMQACLEVLSQSRPGTLYISLLDAYLQRNQQSSLHMYIMTMTLGEYAVAAGALLNLLKSNKSEKLSGIALLASILSGDEPLIRRAAGVCGGVIPELVEALIFQPRPLKPEELESACSLLEEMNRFGRCDGYIKKIIDLLFEAGDSELLIRCFTELFGSGCFEIALHAAEKLLELLDMDDKRTPGIYTMFTEMFYILRDYERSAEMLLKAVELDCYNERVREFGFMLSLRIKDERGKRLIGASELANSLIESSKRSASAFAEDGFDEAAKAYMEKKLESADDGEAEAIRRSLAAIYNRQGNLTRAYELYTNGGEVVPETLRPCPVCGEGAELCGLHRTAKEIIKPWYRCASCGHLFASVSLEAAELDMPYLLAPNYAARVKDIAELLDEAEDASLLVIIGGYDKYDGLDSALSEAGGELGYSVKLAHSPDEGERGGYDAVIAAYPLDDTDAPGCVIDNLISFLKPSGRLYLAFADNACEVAIRERDTDPELRNPARRQYFSFFSLNALLKQRGLKAERQISRLSPRSGEAVIVNRRMKG